MFILKISNRNGGEIMQKYKDKSLNIEERIDDLLSKMTKHIEKVFEDASMRNAEFSENSGFKYHLAEYIKTNL